MERDVGGQRSLRPYWRNYFEKTDAIVWVVDSSDHTRLDDGKEELWMLLQEEKLAGASLLVFANKQDVPGALTPEQIKQQQALIQLIYQLVSRRDDKKMCNFLDAPELTALLPPPSVGAQDNRWKTSAHTSQSRIRSESQEENVSDPWISTSNTPPAAVSKKHRRWRPDDELRVIYRHYATLYFVLVVDQSESELGILDLIQARKASVRSGAGALGAFGGAPTMSSYLAPSSLVQNLSNPSLGSWSDSRSGMDLLQQVGSYYLKLTNSNVHRHRDP
ncbi:hypothetical protein MYAM1_001993 [Malassezia yamatoensis]|uniref:AP complex mu/sigma subunit domain-containing protein n=1 Tax=Malassezia yamatoensis TaxID=253288 RepID=A0AAJ5YZ75_9BASI|nr:hypothetical protein MYAM1_001993 [Malassezia yamatoensis]